MEAERDAVLDGQNNQTESALVPIHNEESLLRRLAGPSTGKAGLPQNQSEINKIIAEVSKNTLFYKNETRKDKELTKRIDSIVNLYYSLSKGADIPQIEAKVDLMIQKLESTRDLSQFIVHVDMDAFFANVELLYNPDLKGKPFAVGDGILTTASYEARTFGVRSGMAGFVAKALCPHLIFVPVDGARYSDKSRQVMSVFRRYDPNMAPAGCDEAYLNITKYCMDHGISADDCVQEMRQKVFEESQLTVSAGIAANKMLAKICSDKNKPNGQFHLPHDADAIIEFMSTLPVRKVYGIGRVGERLLQSVGITTCGDIFNQRSVLYLLDKQFGLSFMLKTFLGIASNNVVAYQREERKSVGAERTFTPLSDKHAILEKLREVAAELEKDLNRSGWAGRVVTLKYKLDTYQSFTRSKSFSKLISKKEDLFNVGQDLILVELPLKVRLLGLRVTKLVDLRASIVEPGSIKRFFSAQESKPRKKRRLEPTEENNPTALSASNLPDTPEEEDSMPGFHEGDFDEENTHPRRIPHAADLAEYKAEQDESVRIEAPNPRPPVSAPARLSSQKPTSTSSKIDTPKPISLSKNTTHLGNKIPINEAQTQECPICGRTIKVDNQGLNAHIDLCLSRDAIRQAQGEAKA